MRTRENPGEPGRTQENQPLEQEELRDVVCFFSRGNRDDGLGGFAKKTNQVDNPRRSDSGEKARETKKGLARRRTRRTRRRRRRRRSLNIGRAETSIEFREARDLRSQKKTKKLDNNKQFVYFIIRVQMLRGGS